MSSLHYTLIRIMIPEGDPHPEVFLNKIDNHHIVQFPKIRIPKGVVPLERLFDGNDVAVEGKVSNEDADVAKCNIGTEEDPKFVKLSSIISREKRSEYIDLLK
jgi:hypothetical protein